VIRLSFFQIAAGIIVIAGLGIIVGAELGLWLAGRRKP
jgi:hypothetical protein